jgi:hypothetical protein
VSRLRAADVAIDMNCVLTRFNRRRVSALVAFSLEHGLDAKFFEHVDVRRYGAESVAGSMAARPHVSWSEFVAEAEKGARTPLTFLPTPNFGEANLASHDTGQEIRYCRYLCPFGLCWITGTRVDPQGFVYNCMVNRGLDRIDVSMDERAIVEVLDRASTRPCRAVEQGIA